MRFSVKDTGCGIPDSVVRKLDSDIPIISSSGRESASDDRIEPSSFDGFLSKPYDIQALLSAVAHQLDKSVGSESSSPFLDGGDWVESTRRPRRLFAKPSFSMREAENDNDRRLLADIRKFGWHIVGVAGTKTSPGYVFTVGLYHTFKHPELCVFGLSSIEPMGQIVDDGGEFIRSGQRFQDGDKNSDLMDSYTCVFKTVDRKYYAEYFGYATWFYQGENYPMLQCVWPDTEHKYPWESDFSQDLLSFQPLLFG